MPRRLLIIVAALRLFGGTASSAETLTEPAAVREALAPLSERARQDHSREIDFLERRSFPFRKEAVETRGVARIDKQRGISIAYPDEGKALIIDEQGLTLRKLGSDGRSRDRRARGSDARLPQLLDALFRFDLEALSQEFELALERREGLDLLTLTPKDGGDGPIQSIRIELSGERPTGFSIELTKGRRIEIEPREERELESFDEATIRRYFGAP